MSIEAGSLLAGTILLTQALLMFVDEFIFHHRRGLPKWERFGHPVDTLFVLLCLGYALMHEPGAKSLRIYLVFSALSCLVVTKDEWVHARLCSGTEHWLHSLLFLLHPIMLGAVAWLWHAGQGPWILAEALAVGSFGVYQLVYWGLLWSPPATK